MTMEENLYLANNSIVKNGFVLGYQVGSTIDGNIIEPPKGYPNGFMVRQGRFGNFDSVWNTLAAAEERANRLNNIDKIKWSVFV